jgi:hypothetical protein
LNEGIKLVKISNAVIVGIRSFTRPGIFTTVHSPKIKEEEWTNEVKGIMYTAKKVEQKGVDFEAVVLADHTAGYDMLTFGNNPKNKIDQIVIGARGMGFPK